MLRSSDSGVNHMRLRFVLPLLLFCIRPSSAAAAPQSVPPAPANPRAQDKHTKWTEADRKELLAKARHGDVSSQFWLGAAYEQGWFGKPDLHEALKWLSKAASRGNPDAQVSLGQMYEYGEGVNQNYALAAKWYRKAAEHVPDLGSAGQGRSHLGQLYWHGLGVPKDHIQAYMWFLLANFELNISFAKPLMSSADILEAERMAGEWKLNHPDPH